MLRPGGAASRAIFRTLRTPSTTASVEAPPFLMTLKSTERRPFSRTTFCCTAQPSCTWPISLTNTVCPLTYLIGILLRSAMVVGIALVRTVYCVSPILARPDGKVRFCALTALTTSAGVSPLASSLTGSMSTMICRYLPPSGVGNVTPMNWSELLAQVVDPVIVELLFIEPIGAQAELQDRNARGIVRHHGRRLYAGRHQGADRICRRDDLGDREIEVDVRLEIDLLDRDAVECLRLHIFDAVDVRADRVLAIGGDALFHLRRAQAGVLPDHRRRQEC